MPPEVRELRDPWPSLVGEVKHLTGALEREFRFGQSVIRINDHYRLGGNVKGGSSAMWVPSDEATYNVYLAWNRRQGLPRNPDPRSYDRLKRFLEDRHVRLVNGAHAGSDEARARGSPKHGIIYHLTHKVLRCLPSSHLDNPGFRILQVGGWGPDGAKASAFDEGTVYLYDFAVSGARRTFLGLLLHEFGHARASSMQEIHRGRLRRLYERLLRSRALIGLEFLLDPRARIAYQGRVFEEFLAETYLMYAALGRRTFEVIKDFPPEARRDWSEVYSTYRELFDGYEYA
jgi:hypothetical protein